jgi:hypothetical protein
MEIVKEFFSQNKNYKAEVIKQNDNLFQVYIYIWDDEWKTWLQTTEGISLTDNEQSAISSAVEHLRNHTGEDIKI